MNTWHPLEELTPSSEGIHFIVARDLDRDTIESAQRVGFDMNIGKWIFKQLHSPKKSDIDYARKCGYTHFRLMFDPPKS